MQEDDDDKYELFSILYNGMIVFFKLGEEI